MGNAIEAVAQELPARIVDFIAKSEDPTKWAGQLKLLDYEFEKHDRDDDPLCIAAEATARGSLFKTSINITLAIRQALRRYLGIEGSEMGETT
jgi:hypothetical protein